MLLFPYGRTVTIVRPGTPDPGGDPGTPEAPRDVPNCVVFPGSLSGGGTSEVTDHADQVVADFTVIFPTGTDILATDLVKDPDDPTAPLCVVVGAPLKYLNPFTGLDPGIAVTIRRNQG